MSITLRPMDHVADPPPPDKIYTPERMANLAEGLEKAIAKIEKLGVDVPGGSRLRNTVKAAARSSCCAVVSRIPRRTAGDCARCF